jgi:hypothetical protein
VIKAVPIHTIKGFVKIKLKYDSRGIAMMAAVEEFGGISKTISDASAQDEARLISANERRN